jgi:Xaa-Pro aminopeptidase
MTAARLPAKQGKENRGNPVSQSNKPDINTATDEIPARLAALRDEMRRLGLDGFIVPRADEHQGEYVAASSERLAWLTGFTGSAGLAVVLADKAAIFIDGRYTLQAEAEVPGGLFEHCPLGYRKP